MAKRDILITSALPYANGPIHIGHMVEYIQTDIWNRFQKMCGHNAIYVCADDAHGTPIMLRAQNDGVEPEDLIVRIAKEHRRDFADFHIDFDNYHTTHSQENLNQAITIYKRLRENGHIESRVITQAYDAEQGMFLPDRFIKGSCPKCGAEDQYGDSCEKCGATYQPTDLINPISTISGTIPTTKDSEHYFFRLSDFGGMLSYWIKAHCMQPGVTNKLDEWFESGLQDWDISRDAPYFGFEIPDAPDKYFYVWLDAPIGYMASFRSLCDRRADLDFDDFWSKESKAELYHFIGKDIAYFHTLFWPAVLTGSGYRTPTSVFCHGFLTVNGQKMSKSRGTFIMARTYLNHLNPEYLRYYLAAKLGDGIDDIDLNLEDFRQRVNSDLVGKVINIASRCAGFINKHFAGRLSMWLAEPQLYNEFVRAGDEVAELYEKRQFGHAMRRIIQLADDANRYIDEKKPWHLIKEPNNKSEVQDICTTGLNLFKVLIAYLKPVLPKLAADVEDFLRLKSLTWDNYPVPLQGYTIGQFKPLMTRIEQTSIDLMLQDSTSQFDDSAEQKVSGRTKQKIEPLGQTIGIDDFTKVDLRVAKIVKASHVEGADKLLRLTLDLGNETREIFAGIKSAYCPEALEGRLTVMVANLAPRTMRFGTSNGMMLAAGPGGEELFLLSPDIGASPGMRVK